MQPNFISTRGQHSLFAGLALVCAVLVSACSFHVSGESKTGAGTQASTGAKSSSSAKSSGEASAKSSGSAKSQASAKSSGKSSSSMKVSTGASGSSKASSSGSVKIGASTSGKSSKSVKFSFKTKARTSGVKRAKKSDNFRGTFLVGGGVKAKGSASGSASVKGSGSASGSGSGATKTPPKKTPPKSEEPTKTPPKKEEPTKTPPKKEEPTKTPPKKTPPKSEEPTKTPPKKEEPAPAPTPAPVPPPVVVIDPPAEPPENVFGYEQPVRGCFEGIVYPLAPNTAKLPTNWVEADALSVVYACEWDIPVRAWEVGFPGVAERFEWFALQYKGSFAVATTGLWKFRISSDDGAKLFIDGKLVIDNDGTHAPQVKEGSLVLTAGDHDMVLEYFQGPRYHINLQLFSTPPGGEEGIFSVR